MKKLWAPWRKHYITAKPAKNAKKSCIFCVQKSSKNSDAKRYILKRSKNSFAVLNRFPYNNGHIMVAPYRHVESLEYLADGELLDLFKLLSQIKRKIDKKLKPAGYNIGLNLGSIGGAGFPGHVHVHMVPRWKGDTNFMPVISDTKVISYSLDEMYKLLKE